MGHQQRGKFFGVGKVGVTLSVDPGHKESLSSLGNYVMPRRAILHKGAT